MEDLNHRPFQTLEGSRLSAFESLDKPLLKPLPEQPYEYAFWKKAKVGIDYHIEVDKRFFSVPYQWVGQKLDVRITVTSVEVLHKSQRVASHAKQQSGGFSICPEHMPKHPRQLA